MSLTESQIQFLNRNRSHYETLLRAQFLTNLDNQVKQGLVEVANVFAPGYKANLWCSPCVVELVKFVYVNYDKWIDSQAIIEEQPKRGRPRKNG